MNSLPLALGKLFVWFWAMADASKEHSLVLWDREVFRAELLYFSHFKVSKKKNCIFNLGPSCPNCANKQNYNLRNCWSCFWESNPLLSNLFLRLLFCVVGLWYQLITVIFYLLFSTSLINRTAKLFLNLNISATDWSTLLAVKQKYF